MEDRICKDLEIFGCLAPTKIHITHQTRMNKKIRRELEVAFSKHAQPIWFRILKYLILGTLLYFLWNSKWLWLIMSLLLVLGLALHFWYRYKTMGWTKDYGGWVYEKNKPQ